MLIDILLLELFYGFVLFTASSTQAVSAVTLPVHQEFLKQGEPASTLWWAGVAPKESCAAAKIENPHGGQRILKNKAVTNRKKGAEKLRPEDITQIQPQKLSLSLRSGASSVLVICACDLGNTNACWLVVLFL